MKLSSKHILGLALVAGLLLGGTLPAAPAPDRSLTPETRRQLIDLVLTKISAGYVLPDVARAMEASVRKLALSGAYDQVQDKAELGRKLTTDLRQVNADPHLGVALRPAIDDPMTNNPNAKERQEYFEIGRLTNFGFESVQRLRGNVGYLDLREFSPADAAATTTAAAMEFLRHTDALIIDLRDNVGGTTRMNVLLASYLFGEKSVHLGNIEWRGVARAQELWTFTTLAGDRYVGKPLYLLTSSRTFSQAEAFAYELQWLKRATVVGEKSAGGAHLVERVKLDADLDLWLPTGRFRHPTTGKNWEGTGVKPDVSAPEREAFSTAYLLALEGLRARNTDPLLNDSYDEAIAATRLRLEQLRNSREAPRGIETAAR